MFTFSPLALGRLGLILAAGCLFACDYSPVHKSGQKIATKTTDIKKESRHSVVTPPMHAVSIGEKLRVDLSNESFDCQVDLQGINTVSRAEDVKNTTDYLIDDTSKLPCFSYTASQVPFVKYPDGRVAIIASSKKLFKNLAASGKITEISCLNLENQINCAGVNDIFIDDYRMVWAKHPSQEKIGQPIKVFSPGSPKAANGNPIDLADPISTLLSLSIEKLQSAHFAHNKISTEVAEKIGHNNLYCEYYDWFKKLSAKQEKERQSLLINEWSKETMTDNPETGLSENRTFGSAINIQMDLVNDSTPHIKTSSIGFYPSNGALISFDNLFFAEVIGWNVNHGRKSCDISFNFDVAQLSANFQMITMGDKDKKYLPYPMSKEEVRIITGQTGFNLPQVPVGSMMSILARLRIISHSYTNQTLKKPDGSQKHISYSSITIQGAQ